MFEAARGGDCCRSTTSVAERTGRTPGTIGDHGYGEFVCDVAVIELTWTMPCGAPVQLARIERMPRWNSAIRVYSSVSFAAILR